MNSSIKKLIRNKNKYIFRRALIDKWREAIAQFEVVKREHDQARRAEHAERMALMKGVNEEKMQPDLVRMLRSNRVQLQSGCQQS